MGRSPSTISRELKRNGNNDGTYGPWRGCSLYLHRRKRSSKRFRLDFDKPLLEAVCQGFEKHWSPEIIAAIFNKANPSAPVGHSTIYRALKRKKLDGYSEKKHLRRGGKRKYCRGDSTTIKAENRIWDRSEIVEKRQRPGDWEVDTVLGRPGRGGLVSAVDRKSRYVVLGLIKTKTAMEAQQVVCRLLSGGKVETLTMDNGSEWAGYKLIERRLNTKIYFADPRSPWQRGSNENINGLVRWFFPKGYDFTAVNDQQVELVQNIINDRPRKCLNWLTPRQVFNMCCT